MMDTEAGAALPAVDLSNVVLIISQWRAILNARLLALLALLGALALFGYSVYDPSPLRLWAASLYAMGVLWPTIYLYVSKGSRG